MTWANAVRVGHTALGAAGLTYGWEKTVRPSPRTEAAIAFGTTLIASTARGRAMLGAPAHLAGRAITWPARYGVTTLWNARVAAFTGAYVAGTVAAVFAAGAVTSYAIDEERGLKNFGGFVTAGAIGNQPKYGEYFDVTGNVSEIYSHYF